MINCSPLRYSIVNKSRRAQRGGEGGQKEGKEKTDEKKKEKEEERTPERKSPIKPHVPATYSIFTTLKFPPKSKRPALHSKPPSGKQPKKQDDTSFSHKEESSNNASKKQVPDTSFYYKDNSSSNYDLTLARKEQEVVAEVHEASPKVTNNSFNDDVCEQF